MFCLGKCISGSKASHPLEDELQVALNRLLLRAEGSTPVEISKKNPDLWIIFTDGACKKGSSVGGVLVSPTGRVVVIFRNNLPNDFFF